MKILVLASAKGGSSKTSLAAHLAVAAERMGNGPTVLLDLDPQGSLTAWWNARAEEAPALASTALADLPHQLLALAEAGYAVAILDTPPAITEAIRAVVRLGDLVLIPVKPSPHDLRAVGGTVEIVRREGRPFVFVITQAKSQALLTVQAAAALSEHGRVAPIIMHDRVDYAGSMTDGRTVLETAPRGPASKEMNELCAFVQNRLHENTKSSKARKEEST